jgi:ornithine carrier protein
MQVQMLAPSAAATGPVVVKTALEAPGSPSSTVTLPASLANGKTPLKGPLALIADTVRQNGLRGLWLGQTGTFLRETGGSAAWFGTYEFVARLLIREHQKRAAPGHVASKADLAAWELMLAGAMGGIAYNVSLFPADCVKSTMQTHAELNPDKPVPGFGATFLNIYRTRGIRGLYAGCALTCLRSGPSSAMIFGLFETLRIQFGWVFEPGFGKGPEQLK